MGGPLWTMASGFPNLRLMIESASNLPSNLGTTNKQRSLFQAQVSKMLVQEFSMKDFLFVGSEFLEPKLHGLILRSRRIPDGQCPSDHAYISTTLRKNPYFQDQSEGERACSPYLPSSSPRIGSFRRKVT